MKRLRLKLRNLFTDRTALILLLVGLILLALLLVFFTDILGVRTILFRMIRGTEEEDGSGRAGTVGVPDMTRPVGADGDAVYFDFEGEDVLEELIPVPGYTRVIRSIRQWDGNETMSQYTLTVNGERWELNGSGRVAFCDGIHTYIATDGYALVTDPDPVGYAGELGISTLEMLAERARDPEVSSEVTVRGQTVRVAFSEPETGIYEQYDISVENGLVLTETSSYWGVIYRTVTTDALSVRMSVTEDEIRFAALREEFYTSHPELREEGEQAGGTP